VTAVAAVAAVAVLEVAAMIVLEVAMLSLVVVGSPRGLRFHHLVRQRS
jgi:hypothetical protein